MDISETYLTLGSATFEIGVPLAAAVASAFAPRIRKFAVVLLGALTPLLVAYALMAASYFFAPAEPSGRFPFSVVWVMSFAVYLALVLVGTALAFIPKPSNLYGRYLVGFLSSPICYALFTLVS
jgi:purine-cytosine permease-like protein